MVSDIPKNETLLDEKTTEQKDSVYGRFGGLIIYGIILVYVLSFFMRGNAMQVFLQHGFLFDTLIEFALYLPIGFGVALSVKTKGLDLSIPAMVMMTLAICNSMESLLAGAILSLIVCIAIGSINAIAIHFLRLPGLLVTFVTLILFSSLSVLITGENIQHTLEPFWAFVLVIISVLVAVTLAIISSINKNPKKQFWFSIFPVYLGIGILAVIFAISSFIRYKETFFSCGPLIYYDSLSLLIMILFIAVFLSITRFVNNKTISLALPLLPCLIYAILENFLSFPLVSNFTYFVIIIILMIILGFRRGRATLIGMSSEKSYGAKAWLILIPLITILVYNVLKMEWLNRRLIYILEMVGVGIVLDVFAVACCILYIFTKPRDLMKKENKRF